VLRRLFFSVLLYSLFSFSWVYAQSSCTSPDPNLPFCFSKGKPAVADQVNKNFLATVTKDKHGAVVIMTVPGQATTPLDVSSHGYDVLHLNNVNQTAVEGWSFGILDSGLVGLEDPEFPLGSLGISAIGIDVQPTQSPIVLTPKAHVRVSSSGFDVLHLANYNTTGTEGQQLPVPQPWNIGIVDAALLGNITDRPYFGALTINPVGQPNPVLSPLVITQEDGVQAFSVTLISDMSLMTNVAPLTNVLEQLAQMRSVSFIWNDTAPSYLTGRQDIGVIAQEVETVFPELVTPRDGQGYKAVDYGKLASVLIGAVNELRAEKDAEVAAIETRLTSQDAQIADLEARLAKLEQAAGNPSTPIQSSINLFTDWPLLGGILTAIGLVFGRYWRRQQAA
jgi:hypothetical protein